MIIGIVGKPNCGKSTFFKACTLAEVAIADYPFTTINKNEGVGFVRVDCVEREFNVKCNPRFGYCIAGNRFIPIRLIDVAGLIPGSYKGLGKGNQFLNDLIQADAFVHVIDISGSTNEKGEIVKKLSYDPAKDIRFLEKELDMWFLSLIKKGWSKFVREITQQKLDLKKALFKRFSGLKVRKEQIEKVLKGFKNDIQKWSEEDLLRLASELRKESKKMIIACNKIDINGAYENFKRLKKEFKGYLLIACSAEIELALKEATKQNLIKYNLGENRFEVIGELNKEQKKGLNLIREFLDKNQTTGVQEVLNKVIFNLLDYIVVYPVENSRLEDSKANKLPDAFLMKKGSTALDLAFSVHSDIGKNFVKAIDLKTKKVIGRDYILKNNDVIEIITK